MKNVFNNAIYGGYTNIVLGSGNVVDCSIVGVGDFAGLTTFLERHGVPNQDIVALREAIDSDEGDDAHMRQELGPAVKGWMREMYGKAIEKVLEIETSVVGSLLAIALNHYYGWVK